MGGFGGYVGPIFDSCWIYDSLVWIKSIKALCWGHIKPILALYYSLVGAMLGLCWIYVESRSEIFKPFWEKHILPSLFLISLCHGNCGCLVFWPRKLVLFGIPSQRHAREKKNAAFPVKIVVYSRCFSILKVRWILVFWWYFGILALFKSKLKIQTFCI